MRLICLALAARNRPRWASSSIGRALAIGEPRRRGTGISRARVRADARTPAAVRISERSPGATVQRGRTAALAVKEPSSDRARRHTPSRGWTLRIRDSRRCFDAPPRARARRSRRAHSAGWPRRQARGSSGGARGAGSAQGQADGEADAPTRARRVDGEWCLLRAAPTYPPSAGNAYAHSAIRY